MNSIQKNNYVFCKCDGKKYSSSYISKIFKKYLKKAKLDEKYHFHCLRHTAITMFANNGLSAFEAKKIAGHSDIKTTQSYVHPSNKEIIKKLNLIDFPGTD